jgi:hypothetical protein
MGRRPGRRHRGAPQAAGCQPRERYPLMDSTSGGRSLSSITCAGAITVSQWQTFSSWRTLPGKSKAPSSLASAASEMRLGSTPSCRALCCRKKRVSMGTSSRRSRSAGRRRRITLRRWNKSSRNTPSLTRCSRFWWVAAITRTLARRRCGRPRGRSGHRTARAAGASAGRRACRRFRRGTACRPSACSKRPRRMVCAPVKAPRSWPNSSDSSRSLGMAAVLMATKGPAGARRMLVQRARHQLLARTRLAGDQHRDLALAQAADGAEHVLHRGRLAEHLGRGDSCAPRPLPRAGFRPPPGGSARPPWAGRRAWAGIRRHRPGTPRRRCPGRRTPS